MWFHIIVTEDDLAPAAPRGRGSKVAGLGTLLQMAQRRQRDRSVLDMVEKRAAQASIADRLLREWETRQEEELLTLTL